MKFFRVNRYLLQFATLFGLLAAGFFNVALAFDSPGDADPAPLTVLNGLVFETFDLNSGTFQTPNGNATGYTTLYDGEMSNGNTYIIIHAGSIMSYAGSNANATALIMKINTYPFRGCTYTLQVDGQLNKGTGSKALDLSGESTINSGGGKALGTVNVTNAITGDVIFDDILTANFDTTNASVNGSITGGAQINFGSGTSVNFSTQGAINTPNLDLVQGTLRINNLVIATTNFNASSGTNLILNANSGFIGGNSTGSFTSTNTSFTYNMDSSNNMPNMSSFTSAALNGPLTITRSNLFIAEKDYQLVAANTISRSGAFSFTNTNYATGTLVNSGSNLYLHVVRNGYDKQAIGATAQRIGTFVEEIGAGDPSSSQFALLNNLEAITNPQQLTAALLSLIPQFYTKIQAATELHRVVGLVEGRIANTHDVVGVATGDYSNSPDQGIWARAFNNKGTQKQRKNLQPYTANNDGFAAGIDARISDVVTLGLGGSISMSNITDTTTSNSITKAKNYQAMLYGSFKFQNDSYLDWILASGVNNYKSSRQFFGTTSPLTAEYSGLNLAAKLIYSKNFIVARYAQIAPIASVQYTYLQQAPYQENGDPLLTMKVATKNMNIFTLGLGAKLGLPVIHAGMNIIPSVYGIAYVDAKGGRQQTFSQFVAGGDPFVSSSQPSILLLKVGVSLDFKFRDKLDLVLSYDLDTRHTFKGRNAFANLRYKF